MGMFRTIAVAVCLAWTAAFAGPMIQPDAEEFDIGEIMEGKASTVMHEFKVKNIGDSVLVIREVRPG